jgi:hypothetical protein
MKIKDIRHLLPSDIIELEETLTSATGKHTIVTQVSYSNLYRYDDMEVNEICIGGVNSYSAVHMIRLIVK